MRKDWVQLSLGEICKFQGGGTPSKRNADYWNGSIPWASIKDVKGDKLRKTQDFITETGLENSSSSVATEGEIILATRINPGKVIITTILTAINQDLKVVKPKLSVHLPFLFWALRNLEPQILKVSSGTTVLGVTLNNLNSLQIKIPPLPIQRAIVAKIEELFSSLDSGIADLKKAQEQLKIYRQAVLKKTFERGWKKVPLSDVCEKAAKVKRGEMEENKTLLYLDIGSIDNNIQKIVGHKEFQWANAPSRAQQIMKTGDILFSTVRTYLKNIAQIKDDVYEGEIASSGFTVLRGKKEIINQSYLFYYTVYQGFLEPLNRLQTGTSYPAVRDKDVFSQLIPLPDLERQFRVVQQIDNQFSICEKVQEVLKEGLEKAEALRQSILKKAFEGKLLSEEEVEKCKQEQDYEPADVLLAKIKAEKH